MKYPVKTVPGMYCLVGQAKLSQKKSDAVPRSVHALVTNSPSSSVFNTAVEDDRGSAVSTEEASGGGKGKDSGLSLASASSSGSGQSSAQPSKKVSWHNRLGHVNKDQIKKMVA